MYPRVAAWAIIGRGALKRGCFAQGPGQFLVETDGAESSYRFPGGGVEWGETAARAIEREMREEYDLKVKVGPLAAVAENMLRYQGREYHLLTLLHWCEAEGARDLPDELEHNEKPGTRLVWRTLAELENRTVGPEGILQVLREESDQVTHLVIDGLKR